MMLPAEFQAHCDYLLEYFGAHQNFSNELTILGLRRTGNIRVTDPNSVYLCYLNHADQAGTLFSNYDIKMIAQRYINEGARPQGLSKSAMEHLKHFMSEVAPAFKRHWKEGPHRRFQVKDEHASPDRNNESASANSSSLASAQQVNLDEKSSSVGGVSDFNPLVNPHTSFVANEKLAPQPRGPFLF